MWSAIDVVDSKEMLAVYASYQRSSLNTIWFMKRVLTTCVGRKPRVLVDGGPWYPWALDRMGFEWEHVTFGKRNAIERLFRTVKRTTKLFYNNNINGRQECAGQPDPLPRSVHDMVQPSKETSDDRPNSHGGGLI